MRYVQLIYNPVAGSRVFRSRLDGMIEVFQNAGHELRIHRTMGPEDFNTFFNDRDLSECDAIIIAGGDGSFNRAINGLKNNKLSCPIGILPSGTANDFARHIGIPDNFTDAIQVLSKLQARPLDVGCVNNRYFINVCSGGLLTNISHTIDADLKNTLGVFAYYIKGIQQLHTFRSISFRITANNRVYDEELYLFLVLNGSSAGGFNRIGEYASMKDGKLDFVGIRACALNDMPFVFAKIMLGDHLGDKNVLYFQSDHILVECLSPDPLPSDVDGEEGPRYPLDIRVLREELNVIVNRNI